jgi:Beta propeller domain/Dockerin type I domain
VKFEAVGSVAGTVAGPRMLDEFDGYLRVFSNAVHVVDGIVRNSTNLSVLQRTDDELKIVGQLLDVADGQSLLSAIFFGENAVITTGETILEFLDPLHGIDISDPTHPVELSDMVIPGASTFLQPVGDNLMVGLGFVQGEDSRWRNQLSLYKIADLAKPEILGTWVSEHVVFPRFDSFRQHALAIQYDAATQLLTVPLHVADSPWFGIRPIFSPIPDLTMRSDMGLHVFKVDPASAQPLRLIDQVGERVSRATIIGDTLLTISNAVLQTYQLDSDAIHLQSTTFLSNPVGTPYSFASPGRTVEIDLLAGSYVQGGRVTAIGNSSLGAELTLVDGRTLIYRSPKDMAALPWAQDVISFTVTYENGESFSSNLTVHLHGEVIFFPPDVDPVIPPDTSPPETPVDTPIVLETTLIEVSVEFVDDNGEVVTSLESGEEYWLQLTATDKRETPNGIYGTWVDLTFTGGAIEVVGRAQGLGDYKNTVRGSMSRNDRIEALGAFSNLIQFPNVATSEIAKIRVRAGGLGSLNLNMEQAGGKANESLLFGSNFGVDPKQMKFIAPVISVVDSHDTNADGEITPIDALILIDHLSRSRTMGESELAKAHSLASPRFRNAQLDVSGDGELSPVDVLMVIDFLATKNSAARLQRSLAAGESTSTPTTTQPTTNVDAANADIDSVIATTRAQDDDLIASLACNFLDGESSLKKSRR